MSIEALQEFTRISRYARYNEEKGRRETWKEQITRVMNMHKVKYKTELEQKPALVEYFNIAEKALLKTKVLGSQRALQFGGPAILKNESRLYNCTVSYADRPRFFQEAMYLLLSGCGVGFSVQKHHIAKLPDIAPKSSEEVATFVIPDSIEGWSDAIGVLLSSFFKEGPFPEYFGKKVDFDFSQVRPEGSIISNTNGRAPGPEPLKKAMTKISSVIKTRLKLGETRLRPIDAYDIVMHSSDAVLAGGVRRSATICLFSPDDNEMASAKTGNWFTENPQRGRSNNSALLLRSAVTKDQFNSLMNNVKEFGEPGFVWADSTEIVFNPCCEIGMWPVDEVTGLSGWQFCNLCEINVKKAKNEEDFLEMCTEAAILGTIQAGYNKFPYLGEITERIVAREALLGISMTGMMDNPKVAFDPEIQRKGAARIKQVNSDVALLLGINRAARTTCIKPAGSTSAILGTASGIHAHHANRYFRRVQVNKMEKPLAFFRMFNESAVKESVWSANGTDDVITFLCEVPKNAKTKNDVDALTLLEYVKTTQNNWVECGKNLDLCTQQWLSHNVSNTINVKDDEWESVTDYIYENRNSFAGISLLPMSGDKDYPQAPFQTVYTPQELIDMYGDASVFASGLVVHALKAFNKNLYAACDSLLGNGEKITNTIKIDKEVSTTDDIKDITEKVQKNAEKIRWIKRAERFAKRYFDGDLRKMTYCLKDVDAWKQWVDLKREYQEVPWEDFYESSDNTKVSETLSCSGGQCEIISM